VSNSVIFALAVEVVFILWTVFLLLRGRATKSLGPWSALVFLILTFVWSVIFGIVLAMNGIELPSWPSWPSWLSR